MTCWNSSIFGNENYHLVKNESVDTHFFSKIQNRAVIKQTTKQYSRFVEIYDYLEKDAISLQRFSVDAAAALVVGESLELLIM